MSHSLCWMPHYSHFYYTGCFQNGPAGLVVNRMCIGESTQYINYHHTSYAFHMSLKSCSKIYQIVWIYVKEHVKKKKKKKCVTSCKEQPIFHVQ